MRIFELAVDRTRQLSCFSPRHTFRPVTENPLHLGGIIGRQLRAQLPMHGLGAGEPLALQHFAILPGDLHDAQGVGCMINLYIKRSGGARPIGSETSKILAP